MAAALFGAVACQDEALNPESVIKTQKYEKNAFDKWLEVNYVNPYNIDFKYRFEMNESDMNYYTVPAPLESSIMMAHLVKYLCIDTYDEVAGLDFTRAYFPKMFFLIGEFEYRNNGTMILGTAEGGKKILLSGLNYLPMMVKSADDLNHYYIKTIHHEFTHILNQTKDFPTDYKLITGTGYVSDSWSTAPYNVEYLKNGFITDYAQYSESEDFAEMLSTYIINPQEYWDSLLKAAGTDGSKSINAKLDIVRGYMKDSWNVDIDVLRATILRRQNDVLKGKIDLTDISID